MHIAETTHEHGVNAKVYAYEADYELQDGSITWRARVRQGEEWTRALSGTIAITGAAAATLAEPAVHDAIVRAIDSIDAVDSNR